MDAHKEMISFPERSDREVRPADIAFTLSLVTKKNIALDAESRSGSSMCILSGLVLHETPEAFVTQPGERAPIGA
jgi:hypothetical protein